jgi:amino acid adenylation domain-containing protein
MVNAQVDSRSVAEERKRLFKLRLAQKGIVAPHAQPIQRVERDVPLPLSFAQQRLWFIDQLYPHSALYNLALPLRLSGALDLRALQQTFTRLVERHESLRTTFTTENGEPVQVIHPARASVIPLIDLTELPESERRGRCVQLLRAESGEPFDLSTGPLLRVLLVRLGREEHDVLLTMHHIISDGWSLGVLVREVSELYETYAAGREPKVAELEVQYGDYAAWQREWLSGPLLEREMEYWRQQLSRSSGVLENLGDRVRPAIASHRGEVEGFQIGAALTEGLMQVTRDESVTLFMLLLAVWQTLLFRYTGDSDVRIGTPIANRNRRETEGLIGFFVNTLVIRSRVAGDLRFTELLKQVRDTALAAYAHQDVPFEKLVEELQPERSFSHAPLFQIMFQLQNAPVGALELTGLQLSPINLGGSNAKFDLTLQMQEANGQLLGFLEYATDLFDWATIKRMIGHYVQLLEGVVADREQTISKLPLLSEAEQEQLITGWNETEMVYAREACVHELFEEQVERTPNAVAVICPHEQISYRELNHRANQLAHHLRGLGVGPEVIVGICVERSLEMVVGLLGILKAGGAYLPIDPGSPRARMLYMFEDAGTAVLLTQEKLSERLPQHIGQTICLDSEWDTIAALNDENLHSSLVPENLAYLIYTSGSTGEPKGVLVEHRSLSNYLNWAIDFYQTKALRVSPLHSSIGFDLSVTSLYPALLSGAAVTLITEGSELQSLGSLFEEESQPALVKLTPSHLRALGVGQHEPNGFGSGHVLVVGGESLSSQSVRWWREGIVDGRLINEYGPTEAVVGCCVHEVEVGENGEVPIGRPIWNTQMYVLGPEQELLPVGAIGELYIGGEGLARGYLGRPDQSAEKFIPHPYSTKGGARLYRTGDRGRYLPNGDIEYLGRADEQVKVRGYRIELAEVEAALSRHAAVRECVVVARADRLDGYVVVEEATTPDELREHLRASLPEYMVPSTFVQMDHLPLTPNGKVDRKALTTLDKSHRELTPAYVAPRNISELWLTQIWEQILGIRPVGVTDSFFELGGHSLLVVRLMEFIKGRWKRTLPLTMLFQYPTIEGIGGILREHEEVSSSPLVGLQTGGSKRPFFCIHAIGGSVFPYLALREYLGPDQPLYGLQSPGMENDEPPLARVEEMAACYLAALRAVQPDGPYLLGGWSMGGLIAYEMTQQLRARGETVELLVLIDSVAPSLRTKLDLNDEWTVLNAFAQAHSVSLENLEHNDSLGSDEVLDHVLEQVRASKLIPPDIGISQVRHLLSVFRGNMQAMQDYVSQPLKNRVHLIRAVDPVTPDELDLALGWAELATEVEIATVEGNHLNLFREPQVAVVAEKLKLWLTVAQRHSP